MKRILFVDDEPNILEALRRMLFSMRKDWDMAFAQSGAEALDKMAAAPFDVLVTDMRMPGMDGSALLREVMARHPDTVRFVLSGQSDQETILRSVGPTHQFLAKPCDAKMLKSCVDRAFALRELLRGDPLKHVVSRVGTLPAMPQLYAKLVAELQSPEASVHNVGKIIESDPAMTARILQLVNSAFFGIRQHVTGAAQAVGLLGLDTIKALALTVGVFSQVDPRRLPARFSLDAVWRHSMTVGMYAQSIAKAQDERKDEIANAYTAGLLHDLGMLILANNCPADYAKVFDAALGRHILLSRVEKAALGCTHADVGAYLLGIWGLPDALVEAVAFHHSPALCVAGQFGPLTAVHVADAFAREQDNIFEEDNPPRPDPEYLDAAGMTDRVDRWRAVCERLREERELS